mmetsp:Transcript_60130/g.160001  ORF Transcript_60130/g.160001 Transcript_60130/m.160001 type:complete len:132 (-) Transcript_60130:49-444(-)
MLNWRLVIVAAMCGDVACLSCNVGTSSCMGNEVVSPTECDAGETNCISYTGSYSSNDVSDCFVSTSECSVLTCGAVQALLSLSSDISITNFQCTSCSTDNCNYEPIGSSGAAERALVLALICALLFNVHTL